MNFSPSSDPKALVALALLACAAGCGPSDGSSERAAADEAFAARNLGKAVRLYEKATAADPASADAWLGLARTHVALGEIAAAKKAVAEADRLAGDDSDVLALSAEVAFYAKDYAAASAKFRKLAEDAARAPEDRSLGWTGLGIVEAVCEHPELAHVAYLRALRLDRRNASAYYHLGLLYRDGLGNEAAALDQFEKFVSPVLNPTADARVQKVQNVFIRDLRQSLVQAQAQRPGAASANHEKSADCLARGQTEMTKAHYKTACLRFEEALKADPLSHPAALALARAWRKRDTTAYGVKQTLENYLIACQLKPMSISACVETGAFAESNGQPLTAERAYAHAVAADPANLTAIDGLIRALRRNKKASAANAYQAYRDALSAHRR